MLRTLPLRLACTLLALAALTATVPARATGLTQLLRRETASLAELERLGDLIARTEQELEEARLRHQQLQREISEAERRRAVFEQRVAQRRRQVALRLRGLYKLSRGGLIRLVLEAPDEHQLSTRLSAASLVLRRDVRELRGFAAELAHLREEQGRLEQARAAQARLAERLAAERARLHEAREQHLAGLRRLRASRRFQLELGGSLDSQQRALLQRIEDLRWKVRSAGGFAALRGRLPQPVGGPVVSIFGRPVEGGGLSLLRNGFTYCPSPREKVHAVAEGLVRVAGPFPGFGRLVVVEHSDGYFSLYGFLSSTAVSEGQRVRRMDPVGRAGIDPMTGRAAAYFELRHRARPLDPAVWLRR